MKVETIRTLEGLTRLRADWQHLQGEVGTLPFTSWEWNIAWWRHLRRRRFSLTDRLYVHLFRDSGGKLVAVAPLMLTALPSLGPSFKALQFFGADKNVTEIRGILCRPGFETEVHSALLERLFARRFEWDCFMVEGFREDGPVSSRLRQHAGVNFVGTRPDLLLSLPKTWEEFRSSRSRNIKESLRKCANSLKRDGLTPTFTVATKGPELKRAVDVLFRLHGARATRKDTIAHPNVFDTPSSRAFLREVCERLGEVDGVRAFTMNIGDRPVATRLGFSIGRSLYLYYSGYDPEYAKYSVMTSVVAEAIKYAINSGYAQVNLSTGIDVSKTRWSPETVTFGSAVVPSDAPLAALITRGYFLVRGAWRASGWSNTSLEARKGVLSVPPPTSIPPIPPRRY